MGAMGQALPWCNAAVAGAAQSSLAKGAVGAVAEELSPHQAALLPWNMEFQVVLRAVLAENCFKNS